MAYTDINSEDRLVQATFADHLAGGAGQTQPASATGRH